MYLIHKRCPPKPAIIKRGRDFISTDRHGQGLACWAPSQGQAFVPHCHMGISQPPRVRISSRTWKLTLLSPPLGTAGASCFRSCRTGRWLYFLFHISEPEMQRIELTAPYLGICKLWEWRSFHDTMLLPEQGCLNIIILCSSAPAPLREWLQGPKVHRCISLYQIV